MMFQNRGLGVQKYTVSDRTLACINYVLNQAEGVVRAASQCINLYGTAVVYEMLMSCR